VCAFFYLGRFTNLSSLAKPVKAIGIFFWLDREPSSMTKMGNDSKLKQKASNYGTINFRSKNKKPLMTLKTNEITI